MVALSSIRANSPLLDTYAACSVVARFLSRIALLLDTPGIEVPPWPRTGTYLEPYHVDVVFGQCTEAQGRLIQSAQTPVFRTKLRFCGCCWFSFLFFFLGCA